jgi:hypothetical protein
VTTRAEHIEEAERLLTNLDKISEEYAKLDKDAGPLRKIQLMEIGHLINWRATLHASLAALKPESM